MITAQFVGGPKRYQGIHQLARTPDLLILTIGEAHHIYQRIIDPDTGDFIDVYEFHSTRYGKDPIEIRMIK